MKWILLFIAIQIVALVLGLVGIPVVGLLALANLETTQWRAPAFCKAGLQPYVWGWPKLFWLWSNDEDGVWGQGPHTRWQAFYWSALRNPANNLRFVRGVSKVGRPLWRKTWGAMPGGWYAQAGWNHSGFPVLSAGRNVNPW